MQFGERSGRDRGRGHVVEVRQVGSLVGEARVRMPAGSHASRSLRAATERSIGRAGRTRTAAARCTVIRAERRSRVEHWEVDTVLGERAGSACIATLVERRTDDVAIGKLNRRTRPPESAMRSTHPVPGGSRAHDHGGRRHRVPPLQGARAAPRGQARPTSRQTLSRVDAGGALCRRILGVALHA